MTLQPFPSKTFPIAVAGAPAAAASVRFTFAADVVIESATYAGEPEPQPDAHVVLFALPAKRRSLPRRLTIQYSAGQPGLPRIEWLLPAAARPRSQGDTRFAQRDALLAKAKLLDPVRTQALAMSTLDRLTDPDHLTASGKADLGLSTIGLTEYLAFRLLDRAAWALADREFEPEVRHDEARRAQATVVEACYRHAMLTAFPGRPQGPHQPPLLDLRAFEQTLAAFVTGELAMTRLAAVSKSHRLYLHGRPDGPNFFCFAEAALLFLRLGLAPRFWRATLPMFVGAAQFFAAHYWSGQRRCLKSYDPGNLAMTVPSPVLIQAVRQRHGAMSTGQLAADFGRTLATALRDEPRLPTPNPLPKEFQ